MEGFFTKKETESISRPNGKILSCASCGLYREVISPRMEPFGNFRKGILNIGEAPGETEDKRGKQWQGKVGRILKRTYRKLGIDLFEDCLNINAINCRPTTKNGNNRTPTTQEIACCRSRVMKIIEEYHPKVIILLGGSAVFSFLGHRWKKDLGGIFKWRGWTIPDRDFNAWVCPIFHPSYVAREEEHVTTIWLQDLERALGMVNIPLPDYCNEGEQVQIIESPNELTKILVEIEATTHQHRSGLLSLDIETTGLKPHAEGHRIICLSLSHRKDQAYIFMLPKQKENLALLKTILQSKIRKSAHNMKFEHAWVKHLLGYDIQLWHWDSMIAAHIIDNRPDITGLKFQTYVNFGVVDYSSEIEEYLIGKDPKNANSINRITELLKTKEKRAQLLTYCGLDNLFHRKLVIKQKKELNI